MFSLLRSPSLLRPAARAAGPTRQYSLSKITLIGRLTGDPEPRTTKNDKEYLAYTVATTNFPPPPANADGSRAETTSSFHRIFSFSESSNNYLKTLKKGALVYVEANFELRESRGETSDGEPGPPTRQVFCRHETLRLLKHATPKADADESTES